MIYALQDSRNSSKVMKLVTNVDVNASVTRFLPSCMFSTLKFVKNLMIMVLQMSVACYPNQGYENINLINC